MITNFKPEAHSTAHYPRDWHHLANTDEK